ncbi:1,4-beta-N-acetylmuramidase [Desulfocucumis palustris]|uniref:Lysozyme n=1 Tax=Desulfocucumis palustris TaxID=1898651 RepID=A0A2L2XEX9_9FIRM|nr:glycoside hydrolase family 25 protein [Desulfocucumis palustris]GBF34798.1 1,4-beta-N-acetylmuramidase [Desulfocucumis palustris]
MQERSVENSRGIDVSRWQGDINWSLVKKDGISFAFIKATEGVDYEDNKFSQNLRGAGEAGILTGAYHFCTPSDPEDAVKEARHFIDVIKKHGGFGVLDLPPVIDIEQNKGLNKKQISDIVRVWIDIVKEESGAGPILYSYWHFIQDYLDHGLSDVPLWLAHYHHRQPPDSPVWKSWLFLQFTDKGRVSGIEGNVDMNEFHGDTAKLNRLCLAKRVRRT